MLAKVKETICNWSERKIVDSCFSIANAYGWKLLIVWILDHCDCFESVLIVSEYFMCSFHYACVVFSLRYYLRVWVGNVPTHLC